MEKIAEATELLITTTVGLRDSSLSIKCVKNFVCILSVIIVGSELWWKACNISSNQLTREIFLA